ncbi:MAG: hypothetical protein JWR03_3007 [Cohnella sp.]|nr:hypothetical protein [Cohnella sp.]
MRFTVSPTFCAERPVSRNNSRQGCLIRLVFLNHWPLYPYLVSEWKGIWLKSSNGTIGRRKLDKWIARNDS